MREKYSCYEFEIVQESIPVWSASGITDKTVDGFTYKIYGEACHPYDEGIIDSFEWYHSENEARNAAIYHIDDLENGEGFDALYSND